MPAGPGSPEDQLVPEGPDRTEQDSADLARRGHVAPDTTTQLCSCAKATTGNKQTGMAVFEYSFDESRDRLALASIYRSSLQKPSTCASLGRPKEGSYLLKKAKLVLGLLGLPMEKK